MITRIGALLHSRPSESPGSALQGKAADMSERQITSEHRVTRTLGWGFVLLYVALMGAMVISTTETGETYHGFILRFVLLPVGILGFIMLSYAKLKERPAHREH
jgi:hypothetical protein